MQSSQSTADWSWTSPLSANFITSRARLTASQLCTAVVIGRLRSKSWTRGPQRSTWNMATVSAIWGPLLSLWSREARWRSPTRYGDLDWVESRDVRLSCEWRQYFIKAPIWDLMWMKGWGTGRADDCGVNTTRGEPSVLHNVRIFPFLSIFSQSIASFWEASCPCLFPASFFSVLGHTKKISRGLSSGAEALILYRCSEPVNTCSSRTHTCLS